MDLEHPNLHLVDLSENFTVAARVNWAKRTNHLKIKGFYTLARELLTQFQPVNAREGGETMICRSLLSAGLFFCSATAFAVPINLKSGINNNVYVIEGTPGTAGTLGVDYVLGTYLAGGGQLGHGFGNAYAWAGGFVAPLPPSGTTAAGAMEATDHNWLQGTTAPIVVDVGAANADDRAIVFNSIDHTGFSAYDNDPDPQIKLWNELIEGIEFTVYGSNNLADAIAVAGTNGVFGNTESGSVPGAGTGSSFEQGVLDYVFIDGWLDHGNAQEGDDYASVWRFSQSYQYIAVYSNGTDPFLNDGFRSDDNELDAIGVFIGDPRQVPEPNTVALLGIALLGAMVRRRRRVNRCSSMTH